MGRAGSEDRRLLRAQRLSHPTIASMRNRLWGELIIDELARCGCRSVWICPGARSAPLAAAAARATTLTASICIDERAAGYQAVGAARASGSPVAVICTSGTAAANLLPAVVEAAMSGVPLLLLTADRPPELRDTGANQTINQPNLFGNNVTWSFDLPVPDARINPAVVLTTIDQAVHRARVAGAAVHLNCMFSEPLLEVDDCTDWDDPRAGGRPYTTYAQPYYSPSAEAIALAAASVRSAAAGLLAIGPLPTQSDRAAVASLAATLDWPVIADVQSGLRFAWADRPAPPAIKHHDLVLNCAGSGNAQALPAPDVVLHLGGRLTSKAYLELLAAQPPAEFLHVAEHSRRIDPEHLVTSRIQAAPDRFCAALDAELCGARGRAGAGAAVLFDAGQAAARAVTALIDSNEAASEPALAADLVELLPPSWGVFGGGSMPIRDLDTFAEEAAPRPEPLVVGANRGGSGIDGAIASAVGYACGMQAPVGALVGDLSVLHDLGSLAVLAHSQQPVVFTVANNDGGGIFSFLPALTDQEDVFNRVFATPHGYRFEHACRMFDLDYYRPGTRAEARAVLSHCFTAGRPALVEVITDRTQNLSLHQQICSAVSVAVSCM